MAQTQIKGVLFDKDGTLFDFKATWNAWAHATLLDLTGGDPVRAARLGARMDYDFTARAFAPTSPVIAGTADTIVDLLAPELPELSALEMLQRINAQAARAPQVEATPLGPLLSRLRGMGLKLGVATNDAEVPARAHLSAVGQEQAFDFIAGYDSGFGAKPLPGMCLAFAQSMQLAPESCVMVGDSTHDLQAGRAAGMQTVAVLTGMAAAQDLQHLADVVLPDISHLPAWVDPA
jgi:phosphoglycolate phosphatase